MEKENGQENNCKTTERRKALINEDCNLDRDGKGNKARL